MPGTTVFCIINSLNPANISYEISNSAKFNKWVSSGAEIQNQIGLVPESFLKYTGKTKSIADTLFLDTREKQEISKM